MTDRTVLRGDADELQALLARWWHDGDLLEQPKGATRLPDGRWQLVVRVSPRLAQQTGAARGAAAANGRGAAAAYPPRDSSAVSPQLRQLDRRLAATVASVFGGLLIAGLCYGAGATGWGLGVLRNLGIAALVLTIAVVLIAVGVNEIRDTRR